MTQPGLAKPTRRDLLKWAATGSVLPLVTKPKPVWAELALPREEKSGAALWLDLLSPTKPPSIRVEHAGRRCALAAGRVIDLAPNEYCVDHDPVSGAPLGLAVGRHSGVATAISLVMPPLREAATIFCQARMADGRLVKRAYVWSPSGYAIVENGAVIEMQGEVR
jgi:hypothetical protein